MKNDFVLSPMQKLNGQAGGRTIAMQISVNNCIKNFSRERESDIDILLEENL